MLVKIALLYAHVGDESMRQRSMHTRTGVRNIVVLFSKIEFGVGNSKHKKKTHGSAKMSASKLDDGNESQAAECQSDALWHATLQKFQQLEDPKSSSSSYMTAVEEVFPSVIWSLDRERREFGSSN